MLTNWAIPWRARSRWTTISLTLRVTAIAGHRCADDIAVIWRGVSIGRIRKATGARHDAPPWSWSCHVHGRPQGSNDRGSGADLGDAKAQFRKAWARIHAIARARQVRAMARWSTVFETPGGPDAHHEPS
jgi:hypothetical protein